MRGHPNFESAVRQPGDERQPGRRRASRSRSSATARPRRASGRYLIGADGASSTVRRSLGIEFEGFTWPDRLLVVSTPFDFYQRHPRPVVGELRRRSGALVLPAANPRAVARDVPGQRGRERRARADARVRAVADGGRRARHLELRDRAHHALQGAPARGQDVPARPRVPGRRRRPHQQSARRHGHERRHPRRRQSGGAARRRSGTAKRRTSRARPLRQAAAAGDARSHPEDHDPEQEEPGIARRRIPRRACARSRPIRRAPATT